MKKDVEVLVAKKYAQAFLGAFIDVLSLDDISNMHLVREFLVQNRRILFFLSLPVIDSSIKREGLVSLIQRFELPSCMEKLIDLLLVHKRTFMLRDILGAIITLYRQRRGIVSCTITSSHTISPPTIKTIKGFLAQHTGCDIIYRYKVDKRLIAGIRVQSDTFLWEYSIAKQLHDMRLSLIR